MQIIDKNIGELKPYTHNPRKNERSIPLVAKIIEEFGFKVPIVIDKDNVIICGHTRYLAAQRLEMAKVPCIIADDLTEEQIRAFRLADNKVSEKSSWDDELLDLELDSIMDIDMSEFGFNLDIFDISTPEEHDERERTGEAYNLNEFDPDRATPKWQMPILKRSDYVPTDLISFNYMLTSKEYNKGIHFYIDDYQFERLWNSPREYIEKIARFDCALTPDFSLYMNMPRAMKMWNVYRSKLIGQMMQDIGIEVIPTLQWAEPETYEWCFDGIPEGGTVSVSTIGVKGNEIATQIWTGGMNEAISRLQPKTIVLYGGDIGYDFPCDVVEISNHTTERMKTGKKK